MRDLTITEQYVLTIIDKKGRIPNLFRGYIVSAMIMDLNYEEFINYDNNGFLSINKELTSDFDYLKEIYNYIKNKGTIKVSILKRHFSGLFIFSNKNNFGINKLRERMLRDGLIHQTNKNCYIADESKLNLVIESLRANILEEDEFDDKTKLLLTLLIKSKAKTYFTKEERIQFNSRVSEVMLNKKALLVKDSQLFYIVYSPALVGIICGKIMSSNVDESWSVSIAQAIIFGLIVGLCVGIPLIFIYNKNIWV